MLTNFNITVDPILRFNESKKGFRAALLQNEESIAFASKSLSETEQQCANIEREIFAIVFRYERFQSYSHSKQIVVESYDKHLQMIHLKNLYVAPHWLQQMLVSIQYHHMIGLVWFIRFYGISTFVGYFTPNPFLCK